MNVRIVIPGGDTAPGRARRALSERLAEHVPRDVLSDMQLLVTEIVANGVRHGGVDEGGEIDLRVDVGADRVRVEMRDTGIQADPRVRAPDLAGGGGFGMVLVARMSRAWGVEHEPNVVMWFELALAAAGGRGAREGAGGAQARPRSTRPRAAPPARYSVALNSPIAMPSITSPSTSTTATSSRLGTRQPNHVTPGSSVARAAVA